MARGSQPGERRGGRQAGVPNKATQEQRDAVVASGLTPLDYMLNVLRDETQEQDKRMWAAEKAAPYVHAKLASVEHTGKDGVQLFDAVKIILQKPE